MKAILVALLAACGSSDSPDRSDVMVNNTGLEDAGVVDAPVDGPNAVLASVPMLAFGSVLVTTESTALSAAVSNSGGSSVISSLVITGAGATAFVVSSETCVGSSVEIATPCTAKVTFAPTTAASMTATLTVNGTANGSVTITLQGSGVTAGALALNPAAGTFGNVTAAASSDVALQLQNVGTTQSGAITVVVSGADADLFQVTANNCAGGLAASATCTLSVRFSPITTGIRSATLTVSNAWGGSITAALSGTGI